MFVCICPCIFPFVYLFFHLYIQIDRQINRQIDRQIQIQIQIQIDTYIHMHMCVCVYVCACVYVYICMYICMYMYTQIDRQIQIDIDRQIDKNAYVVRSAPSPITAYSFSILVQHDPRKTSRRHCRLSTMYVYINIYTYIYIYIYTSLDQHLALSQHTLCLFWSSMIPVKQAEGTAGQRCSVRLSNSQAVSRIQHVLTTLVLRLIMNGGFSFDPANRVFRVFSGFMGKSLVIAVRSST